MSGRLRLVIAGLLVLAFGLGVAATAFVSARVSRLEEPMPSASFQAKRAADDLKGLAEQWQLQLMLSTSEDLTSTASAGLRLGRLVKVDGSKLVVDWLGYNGSTVHNRSGFRQTLTLSPMAVALKQVEIGRGYNGSTRGPAVVPGPDLASVLSPAAKSGGNAIGRADWWILVDSNGQVLQLVQAAQAVSH